VWTASARSSTPPVWIQPSHSQTHCRLWNKPWGLPKLTQTRKANRKKANNAIRANESVLKEAAARDPKYVSESQQAAKESL